jgi:uncharacterized spore protein YtfJ
MTDEPTRLADSSREAPFDFTPGFVTLRDSVSQLLDAASVESVYGEPVEHGETLVIPAAEVLGILGMGGGGGSGNEQDEDERESGSGVGMGGGGRSFARPVAAIVVSPQGVRVEPVIDLTKIALAAITAGGFMLAMLLRMIRPRQALKKLEK